MSRTTKKASVSQTNEALDLKAEIERSNGRSDGTFAFSLAAGAIGLGIELIENEKAHASAIESANHQTESADHRDSAESVVHDTHASVSHMGVEAQTAAAVHALSSTAQGQAHAIGLASPAAIAPNGNEQVRQSESHNGDEAHFSGQAFGPNASAAAGHDGASAQGGTPDETHASQAASLQPDGSAGTLLPPGAGHPLADAGHLADGLLTGIGEAISDVLGPVAGMFDGSDGGNLLTDAVSSVDQIVGEPVGSLLGGVSELTDGLAVSPILEPVTDLLAGATGALHDTLNLSTALTPVTDPLLGTDGLVPDVLSTAASLLGGISGSTDGSAVSPILEPVTDLLAGATGALHDTLNVSTALTPVTDPLLGTDGLVPDVLSTAASLLGGISGSTDGSAVSPILEPVTDLLAGATGALHDTLNLSTALTPVTDPLSGTDGLVPDVLSTAASLLDSVSGSTDGSAVSPILEPVTDLLAGAAGEAGSGHGGNIVSDLLASATAGLHQVGAAVSGAVDDVIATPDTGTGLTSGLVSKIGAFLGGQDTGPGSDIPDVAANIGSADHGDIVSGQFAAAAVAGGSDGATDATANSGHDAPALPGVGDVLDLGAGLGGVIVPVLGYIGEVHFDGVEHHDLGNSHGSLLHMLV